jgi:hypothetical protein
MEETRPTADGSFRSYWIGLLGGGLLTFAAIGAGLGFLAWSNRLAAPPITKLEFLDEKLRFLREHPDLDPTLMVVGSSMAWRQFDGEPFASKLGQGRVLNGATAFLKVHQTRFLTSFYMTHLPELRTIILMLGPPDFENCTTVPADLFDPEDASGYAFERDFTAPLYIRYFSPALYLRRARNYQQRQVPLLGDLWMDKYGSGPMQWKPEMIKELRYGEQRFDHACTDALLAMIKDIKAKGIRPVLVFSPVHPEFRRRYPETMHQLKQVAAQAQAEVRPGVDLFDMSESEFPASDFFDAVHLQWTAVQRFSGRLANLVLPSRAAARTRPNATGSIVDATDLPQ